MKIWTYFAVLVSAVWIIVGGIALNQASQLMALASAVGWVVSVLGAYHVLSPLSQVVENLGHLAKGAAPSREIPAASGEMGALAATVNQMAAQSAKSRNLVESLATGKLDIRKAEPAVLRSGRIEDVDLADFGDGSTLEKRLGDANNQLRRLTLQIRLLAQGQLSSPLLKAKLAGDPGEAIAELRGQLVEIQQHVKAVANGNKDETLEGSGELVDSIRNLSDRLRFLVAEFSHTAVHISSSTEEILNVLNVQEFAATHQASSVEETQRTMETLLSSAKRIAESAQTVFKSAERTQSNNRTVAERIGELKGHSERIAEILEVIKSIADRSDLLALNASLEGLRAGEAGKGFTLVATEMRRLAENIKDSVGDIKELLADIRESSMASVMATEEGTNLSDKTTESALKITLITQQQQTGTEQVTQSMDELSTLISQGVSGTRQLSNAAGELVQLADDLRMIVEPSSSTQRRRAVEAPIEPNIRATVKAAAHPKVAEEAKKEEPAVEADPPTTVVPLDEAAAALSGVHRPSKREESRTPAFAMKRRREDQPTLEISGLSDVEEAQLAQISETFRTEESKKKSFDEQLDDLEKDITSSSAEET
jgi:methyl-accepting chemotaxis protein